MNNTETASPGELDAFLRRGLHEGRLVFFNERIWRAAVKKLMELREPGLFFGLEERLAEEMIILAAALPPEKAVSEVMRIKEIILNEDVIVGTATQPFLEGMQLFVKGAAATICTAVNGITEKGEPTKLLEEADKAWRNGGQEEAVEIVGRLGCLLLAGKDTPDMEIDDRLTDVVRGAEAVAYSPKANKIMENATKKG